MMKKDLLNALVLWYSFILLVLLLSWLTSCKSAQADLSSNKAEITGHVESHIEKTQTNQPIIDSMRILIGKIKTSRPECDSITQAAVDNLLSQLNRYVASGNNSYRISYDLYKKTLDIYTKIGETSNRTVTDSVSDSKYFLIREKIRVPAKLTTEEKTNLWVGRGFWLALFAWVVIKLKSRFP